MDISKVTLVITSMNRPKLLEKTLESFFKYNTYPLYETILIDGYGNHIVRPWELVYN